MGLWVVSVATPETEDNRYTDVVEMDADQVRELRQRAKEALADGESPWLAALIVEPLSIFSYEGWLRQYESLLEVGEPIDA